MGKVGKNITIVLKCDGVPQTLGNRKEDTSWIRKGGRTLLGAGDSCLEQGALRRMNEAEKSPGSTCQEARRHVCWPWDAHELAGNGDSRDRVGDGKSGRTGHNQEAHLQSQKAEEREP